MPQEDFVQTKSDPDTVQGHNASSVLFGATTAFALALVVIVSAQQGQAGRVDNAAREGSSPYAIGLWGDLPYSDEQANSGVPNIIADMNAQRLAFSVHDGDLKAGSNSPCDDALYDRSLRYLNSLEAPAMFTPGDNDWTDCDRGNNGGFNSLERLDHERALLFASPYSL